ncbi:MAG TPA: hypothetical protein VKY85_23905 [Candidatus Angelobacter sp.]|nr:hypothetical protein [Candidatus Angelobacter sp.]
MSESKFCMFIAILAAGITGASWTQPKAIPATQATPQRSPTPTDPKKEILRQASPGVSPSPAVTPVSSSQGEEEHNPDFLVRVQQQPGHDDKSWLRVIWDSLFPWPILIIAIIVYLLFSGAAPDRIESLLRPFQSVKLFGQEFILNQWGGRNAETAIRFYRQEVQTKFDRKAKKLKIASMHKAVIDQLPTNIIPELMNKQVRSTIHVPDMLFDEALYQLIEYYPEYPQSSHGRSFPVRYGIIGKAWRLEESQYAEAVPTVKEQLIFEWGMTKEEAERAGKGRQSFACIVLKKEQRALGIFYLDAPARAAFGDTDTWKKLESAIQEGAKTTRLIDALEAIHKDLLDSSPRVHIFDKAGKSS